MDYSDNGTACWKQWWLCNFESCSLKYMKTSLKLFFCVLLSVHSLWWTPRGAFPVYNQSCTQFKLWMLASCPVTDLWCYSHLQKTGRSVFNRYVGPYKIKSTFCQIFRLDSTTTPLNELLFLLLLTWSTGWFGTYLGPIYDPFSCPITQIID